MGICLPEDIMIYSVLFHRTCAVCAGTSEDVKVNEAEKRNHDNKAALVCSTPGPSPPLPSVLPLLPPLFLDRDLVCSPSWSGT
jgi:hypothetical protein